MGFITDITSYNLCHSLYTGGAFVGSKALTLSKRAWNYAQTHELPTSPTSQTSTNLMLMFIWALVYYTKTQMNTNIWFELVWLVWNSWVSAACSSNFTHALEPTECSPPPGRDNTAGREWYVTCLTLKPWISILRRTDSTHFDNTEIRPNNGKFPLILKGENYFRIQKLLLFLNQ